MRIDLMNSKTRPWYMSLGLRFAKWRVGALPGPPLTISYKPEFFQRDFIGYIVRGMAGSADGRIHPPEVEKGREHLLEIEGATEPDLRRAVEAYVTGQWGWERRNPGDLPPELENYLRKLALHAYRILDEDVESLQKQGYTDDMLYEITLVGAVGAALVGLEAVYQHLYALKL